MPGRSILIAAVALATAACTAPVDRDDRARPIGPVDVLALDTADGALIVASSGTVLSSVGETVAGPDGSRLYATARLGDRTRLETTDAASGDRLSSVTLNGALDVRVASLTGSRVALMHPSPPGVDPSIALPRARTTIVVADPSGETAPRVHRLAGNFEPEAFSVDDGRLFLIQYLPALAPSSYRVTVLDLDRGTVRPVFGRFRSPPERMPGVRLAQVFDPVAEQLYTLYTNRVAAHFHDHWQDAGYRDREVSFVHVLNLRAGWAYCAGLPRSLWGRPAAAQAMAPSPDGRSLFIVDSRRELVAELDTRSMRITRTRRIDLGSPRRGPTSALVGPDGETLWVSVGGAVSRIDVERLEVLGRSTYGDVVRGLASSRDGDRLFLALGGGITVVDVATGRSLASRPFGSVEAILHVGAA